MIAQKIVVLYINQYNVQALRFKSSLSAPPPPPPPPGITGLLGWVGTLS